jgi:hypothetical protein
MSQPRRSVFRMGQRSSPGTGIEGRAQARRPRRDTLATVLDADLVDISAGQDVIPRSSFFWPSRI